MKQTVSRSASMKRLAVALTSVLLLLAAFATHQANAAGVDFTAKAKAAGLSSAQSASLQENVDRYLAALGGTQVAPNVIDLGGRSTVFVAVPGEVHPRDLSNGTLADPCAGGGADPYYFCAYSGIDWTGTSIAMYTCKTYTIPYAGNGSWDNNQSAGTKARMYNPSGTLIYTTPGARSYDDVGSWSPVHTVRNC
ncbi:hypothetical protein [Streptomyces sp. NPDC048200]|uniref:hypothetical protein n=1 Tax=Streptomyces sp. NPDC048200 TaxID=3365512 RepID=UPI003715A3F3